VATGQHSPAHSRLTTWPMCKVKVPILSSPPTSTTARALSFADRTLQHQPQSHPRTRLLSLNPTVSSTSSIGSSALSTKRRRCPSWARSETVSHQFLCFLPAFTESLYCPSDVGDWERITVRTVNGVATQVDYHAHSGTGSGYVYQPTLTCLATLRYLVLSARFHGTKSPNLTTISVPQHSLLRARTACGHQRVHSPTSMRLYSSYRTSPRTAAFTGTRRTRSSHSFTPIRSPVTFPG